MQTTTGKKRSNFVQLLGASDLISAKRILLQGQNADLRQNIFAAVMPAS
jgi:hypothetical protein